jgi:hypothetical protein
MPKPVAKEEVVENEEVQAEESIVSDDDSSLSASVANFFKANKDSVNDDDDESLDAPSAEDDEESDDLSSILNFNQEEKEDTEEEGVSESENEEEIVNQDGSKPTTKTSEFIRKLKDDNAQLRTELETAKANAVDPDELKALKEERDKLKSTIDTIHFEKSESFQKKYVAPVNEALKRGAKSIESIIPKSSHDDVMKAWNQATAALTSGNEALYLSSVSSISDEIPEGIARTRFEGYMSNAWDKNEERSMAMDDMSAAREKLVSEEQEVSERNSDLAGKRLDSIIDRFEEENQQVLSFYRSEKNAPLFQYDEVKGESLPVIKRELKNFIKTGQISDTLGDALIHGALRGVHLNERKTMIESLKTMSRAIESKDAAIKELKDKIKKSSVSGGRFSGKKGETSEEETSLGAALSNFLGN